MCIRSKQISRRREDCCPYPGPRGVATVINLLESPEGNGSVSFSRGRTHRWLVYACGGAPAARIARVAVLAALMTWPPRRLARALMPGGTATRDAVCHRYPQFTTIHGLRASRGYHGDGRALDGMISDSMVGGTSRIGSAPTPRNWASARSFIGSAFGLCSGAGRAASGCQTGVHRLPVARTTWMSPSTATAQRAN